MGQATMRCAGDITGIPSAILAGLLLGSIGCGGIVAASSMSSGGAADQTASSPTTDSGPWLSDSAADIIEDARAEAKSGECACPPGSYGVAFAVGNFMDMPLTPSFLYSAPYFPPNATIDPTLRCADASAALPTVPWSCDDGLPYGIGIYACSTADQTRSCLALAPSGVGTYLDQAGQQHALARSFLNVAAHCTKPPCILEGDFTLSVQISPVDNMLSGTFQTCFIGWIPPRK